jgi:hypothetical protein
MSVSVTFMSHEEYVSVCGPDYGVLQEEGILGIKGGYDS